MTVALAVGGLLALAVALLVPARRPPGTTPPTRHLGAVPDRRLVRRRRGGRGHRPAEPDLGVVVTEVATRLRAGADVESAWRETFARIGITSGRDGPDDDGVPGPLAELARRQVELEGVPRMLRRLVRRPGVGVTTAGALPGALAACRLTHELGAPLAQVLERCAHGLTEAGNARAARSVALAGPRSTARLLGWLPLLGLVLGAAVGADPVAVLLGGGLGSVCLVGGVALMVLGRRWVATLERAATAAGESFRSARRTGPAAAEPGRDSRRRARQ
ncbi:type II secretion protein F [Georgenia subflava]|uniref:Type II secretion protein F n=1 Tax=Georgenia subflava TaxID=1622177 RepID=A0A6N7ENN7_9MICO|nr:type II secretion protein F [Georgenia subflava]MPV38728.1 type II secretion protein F [Georgenia subflava]